MSNVARYRLTVSVPIRFLIDRLMATAAWAACAALSVWGKFAVLFGQ